MRDICFFIVAVGFAVGFLFDGQLHFVECLIMIGFYIFYVVVVVGWHAYLRDEVLGELRKLHLEHISMEL